jgi:hypothetical protein
MVFILPCKVLKISSFAFCAAWQMVRRTCPLPVLHSKGRIIGETGVKYRHPSKFY